MTRGEPAWKRFRGVQEGRAKEEIGRQLRGKVEPGQILLFVCLPSFPFFLPSLRNRVPPRDPGAGWSTRPGLSACPGFAFSV